jgi:hypothetical protein
VARGGPPRTRRLPRRVDLATLLDTLLICAVVTILVVRTELYLTNYPQLGRGNVWWFEQPWIWRFPLDYYLGIGLSIVLAALAAWSAGTSHVLEQHLWMLAVLAVLIGLTVLAAPLYHRWYRHMRRAGADDRRVTHTYPPPAPEEAWAGGDPDLHPLDRDPAESAGRREP